MPVLFLSNLCIHVMPPDSIADFGIEPNTFMNDIYFTHCTQAGHTDDVIQSYFKWVDVCGGGVLKHGGRFAITARVFKLCLNVTQRHY